MKALIQRVKTAHVQVDTQNIGTIDYGILAYIGLGHADNSVTVQRMIDKILTYRIFENTTDTEKQAKLDKNVQQVNGGLLLIPQFTLMAKTDKGRRPDFGGAMAPDIAKDLFNEMVAYAQIQYPYVASGQFGANMQVSSINDGPLNFLLEL